MQAFTPEEERAERAARVRTMLQRWAQEPEGIDPDWSIEEIEPPTASSGPGASSTEAVDETG